MSAISHPLDKAGEQYWTEFWRGKRLPPPIRLKARGPRAWFYQEFHDLWRGHLPSAAAAPVRLLEIGCAQSRWLPYFAQEWGYQVAGLDYSELGCRQSRALLAREGLSGEIFHQDMFCPESRQVAGFDVVFSNGGVGLRVGKRTLRLVSLPGHSADGIGVLVVEDRVLFSGDIMMPIPYLVDGDYDLMVEILKRIPRMKLENLVQGHGEVVLRGEVSSAVRLNLKYLNTIRGHVRQANRRKDYRSYLEEIDVESCGKSRILLGGLAENLHQRNLFSLFQKWYPKRVDE